MTGRRQSSTRRAIDALVDLVRTDDLETGQAHLAELRPDEVADLVQTARAHGVEAWLAACLPLGDADVGNLAAQRPKFLAARARSLVEAQSLGRRLDAAGIPWCVLKGLAIAETVYPRPDLRHSVDLDVLVPPQRFQELVRELIGDGYTLLDVNWPVLARLVPGQLRLRAPNGTLIDLHWHLLNQPALRAEFDLATVGLLEHARPILDGRLQALDPADQLVHTAVHAAMSGANRLLWLVDLDRLLRFDQPGWDAVESVVRRSRTGLPVAVAIDRTRRVLGTAVGTPTLRHLAGGRTWLGLTRTVDRRRLLRPDPSRPATAVALARSSRSTLRRSQAEFLRHGLGWVRSGAPRSRRPAAWLDPADATSALHAVADVAAEAAYFTAVATSTK